MVAAKQQGGVSSWMNAAPSKRIDLEDNSSSFNKSVNDIGLGFGERALSAAGAAVISAIIVNPLDVAKVSNFNPFLSITTSGAVIVHG